jgi:hypothetical protein
MIRFLLSSIFFVLVSVNAANGQASGVLSGRVTDSSTGEPLAGVYAIYGKNMGEMTDSLGHFIIKAPAGHISVKFTFLGYESITRDFRLIAGDTLETEVSLKTEIKEIGSFKENVF